MNGSQKYIKNLIFENNGTTVVQNTPVQYKDRQKQYLSNRTKKFADQRAYLSSDFVQADVQGISNYFYDFIQTEIRLSDISTLKNSFGKTDDYKQVLLPKLSIDYLPLGAKIKTMSNMWLVINPSNMSTALTTSVIARCNATYNSLDYYGNIITEPIVVEKYSMAGNDNESPINIVLMDGYFNITCQLNKNTKKLGINKRIMLGDKPYYITGFTDFIQEFTNDTTTTSGVKFIANPETGILSIEYPKNYVGPTYKIIANNLYQINPDGEEIYIKSGNLLNEKREDFLSHIITFTARIDEPNKNDDLINCIADGNSYKVSAELNGITDLIAGTQTTLIPSFLINGEVINSTEEHPLNWHFKSSNPSIAKINNQGVVTSISEGSTKITAILSQNPSLTATLDITVTEQLSEPYIAFDGFTADYISQYDTAKFTATYFENNYATNNSLEWTFSGPSKQDYNAIISKDGKTVEIECLSASDIPLTITAKYNDCLESIIIHLVGY